MNHDTSHDNVANLNIPERQPFYICLKFFKPRPTGGGGGGGGGQKGPKYPGPGLLKGARISQKAWKICAISKTIPELTIFARN